MRGLRQWNLDDIGWGDRISSWKNDACNAALGYMTAPPSGQDYVFLPGYEDTWIGDQWNDKIQWITVET
jgi:hypothetical protein